MKIPRALYKYHLIDDLSIRTRVRYPTENDLKVNMIRGVSAKKVAKIMGNEWRLLEREYERRRLRAQLNVEHLGKDWYTETNGCTMWYGDAIKKMSEKHQKMISDLSTAVHTKQMRLLGLLFLAVGSGLSIIMIISALIGRWDLVLLALFGTSFVLAGGWKLDTKDILLYYVFMR